MEKNWPPILHNLAGSLVFLFAFLVYLSTLSPTVGFIDCGELTTVCHSLGIAHPTGYPLYTLLGRLFTLIPLREVAWRVNLASAFYSALSAVFLYFTLIYLGGGIWALASSILFAFASSLWSQATQAEVYSLTVLLATVLLWLVLSQKDRSRRFLIFAFFLGLSFGNHMIIAVFAIPSLLYLVLSERTTIVRRLPSLVCFFLLGLSVYLYLPLRSAQGPLLNWGDPSTLVNFFRHVSGKQYRVWMFSTALSAMPGRLVNFLRLLLGQFTPFLLPFLPIGVWQTMRRDKGVGVLLVSIFFLDVFYALNYDIPDIEPYFLPAFLIAAVWTGGGLSSIPGLLRKPMTPFLSGGVILISLLPLFHHYPRRDESRNYIAYDYGMDILRSIERNGICITNDWDIYSPTLYIGFVQGIRRDVVLIDKELLRRSWYFDYLERQYPWLMKQAREEVESYLELLKHFEEGTLKDPGEIQRRFIYMIDSFISQNLDERPVYLTFMDGFDQDAPAIAREYKKVPHGLVYRVYRARPYQELTHLEFSPRGAFDESVPKDERTRLRLTRYPGMLFERGVYEMGEGNLSAAISLFRKGLVWDLKSVSFHQNLGMCYLALGEYGKACEQFKKVLELAPDNKAVRNALARTEAILKREAER